MKTSLCFALLLLWSAAAFGQPAFLVKDLGLTPSNGSSQPTTGVEIAGVLYFAAEDDAHGRELWRTDGTTEGTRRVSDICPGPCNGVTTTSLSEDTAVLSEVLFFVASDGVSGKELWRSDGTSRGTFRVRDLCPGRCSVGIRDLAAYDGLLFFAGEDPFTGGRTLWSTDGTRAATRPFPLADCGGSENPAQLRVGGGLLYFVASHPESGRELWRTNGTCQGTMLVKDICLDCPIAPRSLTAFEDRLLFWAFDVTHGYELWSTQGTSETTHLVVDLIPGPEGSTTDLITPFGGKLYYRLSFCPTDLCVYKTDGTAAGTEAAVELDTPGERPVQLLPVGNQLYFETSGISIGFRSLWVTNGDPATTRRVAEDFYPPMNLLADQAGWLLFGAQTEPGEAELWRSDGSAVGTAMVLDINPREGSAPRRGSTLGQQTLFVANDGVHGRELWRSDGSAAGTELVADLHPSASSAKPADLVAFNDRIYFTVEDSIHGRSVWGSDGTAAGTAVVAPEVWARPGTLTATESRLFFVELEAGLPLWVSDGTASGTQRLDVADDVHAPTPVGDVLYFAAGAIGQQLWRSDGTVQGTRRVVDVNPFYNPICQPLICFPVDFPNQLTAAGESLFFVAFEEGAEEQLWHTDGTAEGSKMLREFAEPPTQLTALSTAVVFSASDITDTRQLWASDGTPQGTVPLTGSEGANPRELLRLGDSAFFASRVGDFADELWRSDGTVEGTQRVSRLTMTDAPSQITEMAADDGRIFLAVYNERIGHELWVSGGTAAGTYPLANIRRGRPGLSPHSLVATEGLLLFAADDGRSGVEPWISDGTERGTRRLQDLALGQRASNPAHFTRIGSLVFFSATADNVGRELFALDVSELQHQVPVGFADTPGDLPLSR